MVECRQLGCCRTAVRFPVILLPQAGAQAAVLLLLASPEPELPTSPLPSQPRLLN